MCFFFLIFFLGGTGWLPDDERTENPLLKMLRSKTVPNRLRLRVRVLGTSCGFHTKSFNMHYIVAVSRRFPEVFELTCATDDRVSGLPFD